MDKYDHMIVWLDQNITSPDCCKQLKKAFATTTNPENKFLTNIDEQDISINRKRLDQSFSFLRYIRETYLHLSSFERLVSLKLHL